jgi:hypothetical protein
MNRHRTVDTRVIQRPALPSQPLNSPATLSIGRVVSGHARPNGWVTVPSVRPAPDLSERRGDPVESIRISQRSSPRSVVGKSFDAASRNRIHRTAGAFSSRPSLPAARWQFDDPAPAAQSDSGCTIRGVIATSFSKRRFSSPCPTSPPRCRSSEVVCGARRPVARIESG